MHHELAMEHLAQQRSEDLIRRAEQENRLTGSEQTRRHRIGRNLATLLARARTTRPGARPALPPSSSSHAKQP
jgi:hypothetical protein